LRQYSRARDLRHLKALAWMVSPVADNEAYPPGNRMCKESESSKVWSGDGDGFGQSAGAGQSDVSATRDDRVKRMEPSSSVSCLDTVLWNRYCMKHKSVVCCGRAVPLLWRVLAHGSATVAFKEYQPLLRKARWLLLKHPDVMLLADRGFTIMS